MQDKVMVVVIVDKWLKLCTPKFAPRKVENIPPIYDLAKEPLKFIQYGSKIFTEPDLQKHGKEAQSRQVYLRALCNIFSAMKGKRIFDRFGFDLPKPNKADKITTKLLSSYKEWEYDMIYSDWKNILTGEKLSGYELPNYLGAILEHNINNSIH